jgi:hypothetical protein
MAASEFPDIKAPTGVPKGKITKFSKDQYQRLIGFVNDADDYLNDDIVIQPDNDVDFRSPEYDPGSATWHPAQHATENVKALSTSLYGQLDGLGKEFHQFAGALKDAAGVFEKTDDLASYSATDFTDKYPGITGGAGTGTGAGTGS